MGFETKVLAEVESIVGPHRADFASGVLRVDCGYFEGAKILASLQDKFGQNAVIVTAKQDTESFEFEFV